MKPTVNVVAAVLIQDGKILATRRNLDRILGGRFEFPGGKIELGETPKQALRREIYEELGDMISIGPRIETPSNFEYSYAHINIQFYLAKLKTHNLNQVAAHDFIWDYPQNLLILDWLPATRPVLEWLVLQDLTKVEFDD
ncbi:(deoxy)nucleoside triphosphate pyrophosphohydrolase [Ligilactobacillus sp. Marseille-Q7487]|uniref:(deoxy)nucleoside triphosphate pyrophosphohydrolase n=1 Tax=Ligilactobacillus sp. Marseille-Q7487 TaxID=3022128 RepID=UPI0015B45979|nr:(deoxy)nucleoside triphosphate pyrophosphohydrolase [Ligilactobacillus sp. Marseille-Q7487]